jgi:site-specific recombinase XerD
MKPFESFLAPQLEEFITYRQNLGYDKRAIRTQLLLFDRYLAQQQNISAPLQPSFFLQLQADLQMQPASVNKVLYAMRCFFEYLVRKGDYLVNPLRDIPPRPQHAFIPFVFAPQQVDLLLRAVCKKIRQNPKLFLKDLSLYMAIVLIARCGLRITEPLRLRLDHYRVREKTIYIAKTKFKKDRLLPVPIAVAAEIENYLETRKTWLPEVKNPYLLPGDQQKRLSDHRVRLVFHQAVKDIGLDQSKQRIGNTTFASPTPHSLRHSFAVNTLKLAKAKGKSPQSVLPVLAAYLGHSEYRHTIKYLKVIDAQNRQQLLNFAGTHREEQ